MLFNSAIFIVLFFTTYVLYWFLPVRGKHYLIITASIIFYGWYSIPFLLLFLFLMFLNYAFSIVLLKNKDHKILWSIIAIDLLVLGFFKYFYLFAKAAGYLLGFEYLINLQANWLRDYEFQIFLPIAISFYTFQMIAYVVDSYRGVISERVSVRRYTVFILFFPQFIAGPIMRSSDFIPQIDRPVITRDSMLNGVILLLQGVLKKVLIADRLGAITGDVWMNPSKYDAAVLVVILPSFAFQIYCDFSGYTDMARGMGRLLGYEIPENFAGPYLAKSIQEFWQRWHITLSTWLRDYIYIPLGGSRKGRFRAYLNILLTLALGGFWHGATWNMMLWGLYLGSIMVVERFMIKNNIKIFPENRTFNVLRVIITFSLVAVSSLLFASPDIYRTGEIVSGIFSLQRGMPLSDPETVFGLMLIVFLLNIPQHNPALRQWVKDRRKLKYALSGAGIFLIGILVELFGDSSGSFVYFQF